MTRPADFPRSPRSTFDYCVSAIGKTVSVLMNERFASQEIIFVGEETPDMPSAPPGGKPRLNIVVAGRGGSFTGYAFDRDFLCFEVCIYIKNRHIIDGHERFFDSELTKIYDNVWQYRGQPCDGGNSVTITTGSHEAPDYIVIYTVLRPVDLGL